MALNDPSSVSEASKRSPDDEEQSDESSPSDSSSSEGSEETAEGMVVTVGRLSRECSVGM
eukprot:scaffold595369_cov34-Prasinocladus_malaysianus.AAC.1